MTLGEGAAMFTLETLDSAQARNATIYAEIVGFGMSADASHITQPHAEGAATAMRQAIADANASPDEVGYINAHGTGTQANDATEAAAIHQVFGTRASQIPVSSTKSLHGHSIGASGALEALATILALQENLLPPTPASPHRPHRSTSTSSSRAPPAQPHRSPSPTHSPSVASTPSSRCVRGKSSKALLFPSADLRRRPSWGTTHPSVRRIHSHPKIHRIQLLATARLEIKKQLHAVRSVVV